MPAINPYLKLFFGLMLLLLGFGYIYKPGAVERLNRLLKETLLNDSYVALHHKKWGVLLVLIGSLLVYMGLSRLCSW
ncbi:MAG: hypothetical protein A2X34_05860 [Elusimicrobia bacterium GWC2_51_8]|nr:MAG: hypothetical protein A2X33_03375 [Elusimicrobia bacterium GWA2_51_34]OGR58576.1 MAG: hypothetical protein A2X34_05860 [Elusimicrobia bacterium GWC2_51_8]OGR86039.1 MAG: hypothetical protein A2021_09885 [Elusimicrobia bacterium GWF2_52_66]HAF95616.1 hypothetical protein [Elusimicrobiota bacterium]HCE98306.1 hypothetical protein [Elusimicrobiota bacterium]